MKNELIKQLEELIKSEDPEGVREEVHNIETAYHQAVEEHEKALYDQHIADGGDEEHFKAPADPEDARFKELMNIYQEKLEKFAGERRAEEQKNLAEKRQIIEDLKELITNEENIGTAFNKFNELRERWKTIGKVPGKEYRQLQSDYSHQIDLFFYTIKIFKDLKELDLKKNLEQKQELIKNMQALVDEESIKKSEDLLRAYQEEWDNTGPVPHDEWEKVRDEFRKASGEVFHKIQAHYDQIKQQQKENHQAKMALIHKVETILSQQLKSHKKWKEKTDQVIEIQKEWKKIGFASRDVNEKLWKEFRTACDTFFERKQHYYENLKEEREQNKQKKLQLIEKAEAIKDSQEWKNTTETLIALQKEWTATGSAARKDEQELWKQFRAACDTFFNNKKEYFSNIDQIQEQNMVQKLALIEKIEQFQLVENHKDNLQYLRDFVKEWNDIGHVPRKNADEVNSKFKETLDKKYDALKLNKDEKAAIQYKNKLERLMQSSDSDNKLRKERRFIQENIHKLEQTIEQYEHNLNFFNVSKGSQGFIKEVEEKINRSKAEVENLKKRLKMLQSA